ncbi:MAG: DNA-3-methyladenine glycosylase [Spirochaetaceae bacterium]
MRLQDLHPPEAAFFSRGAVEIAQRLLGTYLISEIGGVTTGGRIVETEAYTADDPASHSFPGPRERNSSMFQAGGTLYVYLIYGVHYCLNVVTGAAGAGEAVLLRAIEPVWGANEMARRRGKAASSDSETRMPSRGIGDGPGKIAEALGVTAEQDGSSLLHGPVRILLPPEPMPSERIIATHRIGITRAARMHRRFVDGESELLSKKVYRGRR